MLVITYLLILLLQQRARLILAWEEIRPPAIDGASLSPYQEAPEVRASLILFKSSPCRNEPIAC